jgi:hypothetical protein
MRVAALPAVGWRTAVEGTTFLSERLQGGKSYGISTLESHDAVEAVPGPLEPLHGDGVVAE